MKKMFNEGKLIHNFISSSGSRTVTYYGSGSDFLTSYGSGYDSGSTTLICTPYKCRRKERGNIRRSCDKDKKIFISVELVLSLLRYDK
jgi:hypothetical protein